MSHGDSASRRYDVPFRAPTLPYPPREYYPPHFETINSILRLYFTQIDNALRNVSKVTTASSAAVDYTVAGTSSYEIVVMTNPSTAVVLLPLEPNDLLQVSVKRTNAQVTVNGNGHTIDGAATKVLGTALEAVNMTYLAVTGTWVIL